jgi:NhaP-type Na+/H+ or K+/H+ antiporter
MRLLSQKRSGCSNQKRQLISGYVSSIVAFSVLAVLTVSPLFVTYRSLRDARAKKDQNSTRIYRASMVDIYC